MQRLTYCLLITSFVMSLTIGCREGSGNPTAIVMADLKLPTLSKKPDAAEEAVFDFHKFAKSDAVLEATAKRCQPLFEGQSKDKIIADLKKHLALKATPEDPKVHQLSCDYKPRLYGYVLVVIWLEELQALNDESKSNRKALAILKETYEKIQSNIKKKTEQYNTTMQPSKDKTAPTSQNMSAHNQLKLKVQSVIIAWKKAELKFAAGTFDVEACAKLIDSLSPKKEMGLLAMLAFMDELENGIVSCSKSNGADSKANQSGPKKVSNAEQVFQLRLKVEQLKSRFGQSHPSVVTAEKELKAAIAMAEPDAGKADDKSQAQEEEAEPKVPTESDRKKFQAIDDFVTKWSVQANQRSLNLRQKAVEMSQLKSSIENDKLMLQVVDQKLIAISMPNQTAVTPSISVLKLPNLVETTPEEMKSYQEMRSENAGLPMITFQKNK